MSPQKLFWPLLLFLLAALGLVTVNASQSLQASVLTGTVEKAIDEMTASGRRGSSGWSAHQLRLLDRAASLDPALINIRVNRGLVQLVAQKPQAAIRALEQALEHEERAEIYANLGQAHNLAGDRKKANEAFQKAFALDPGLRRKLRKHVAYSQE